MLRTIGFVAVGVSAVSAFIAISDHFPNEFRSLEASLGGRCEPVAGLGPVVSADAADAQRIFAAVSRRKGERGAIYLFDAADPLAQDNWRDRSAGAPAEFDPVSIDFLQTPEGARLFVANAATASVELYGVAADGALEHLRSFRERRLTAPAAVAAVGPSSFYVVNDERRKLPAAIAAGLRFSRSRGGEVLYTNGAVWRLEASGFAFASSIAVSADGGRVVIGEAAGRRARLFDRAAEDGALSPAGSVALPGSPRAIHASQNGFAVALRDARLKEYFVAGARREAGSAVVELDLEGGRKVLFHSRDADRAVAPVSAGARAAGALLLGSEMSETSFLCALNE